MIMGREKTLPIPQRNRAFRAGMKKFQCEENHLETDFNFEYLPS